MNNIKTVLYLLIVLFLHSCAHSIHMVNVGDFSAEARFEEGELVESSGEQFVFMGFVGNTDYVNQAYTKLIGTCKNGEIQGITTRYSTSLGFFSWTNKIFMKGLCIIYDDEKPSI